MRHKDVLVAEDYFGTHIHSLKGKTVCKEPNPTGTEFSPLPSHIMPKYKDIRLCADLIKVNGV